MAIIPRIQEGKAWYNPTRYEFGASEAASNLLKMGRNSQGGSNLFGSSQAASPQVLGASLDTTGQQENLIGTTPMGPPAPTSNGAPKASGGTLKQVSTGQLPQANIISPNQNLGGSSQNDLINSEFSNFNSFLDSQAGAANQNFANTEATINSERDNAITDANAQRGIRTTDLSNKAEAGRANERLNLQKVRQLLQDLDQKNAARTAVTGGGGSVNEALADRFSRTAQQNVGGVLQEGQRYQSQIELEKTKANQFYDDAINKIKTTAQTQIDGARAKLNENLSGIDAERRASAQQKATARYDAWRSYYDQVNQAKIQAANFQTQYDQWLQGKSQELAAASQYQTGNVNDQNFSSYLNGANYNGASTGVGSVNPVTYAPTQFSPGKRQEDQVDQFGNPISTPSMA